MYNFGPELDPASVAWLKKGAVFPETLEVHLRSEEIRHYTILDRDENGVVTALREGRRGKKGFVLRVRDNESGETYAAKLCIPEDYTNTTPVTEIEFANALRSLDELVLCPKLLGTVERFEFEPRHGETSRWICFIRATLIK